MEEEYRQSPADLLGGKKISYKTLESLFDVKEHWIRLLEAIPKDKVKGKKYILLNYNVSDKRVVIASIN